ncbi:methyltransferase domain-containing protein [Candidatus Woesearchaeota archaeon]|nr:methyltransferase domain-containing protein [Candidatus Woesearchaeota archaeon]
MSEIDMKGHWEKTYGSNEVAKLGWYEESPAKCLELFEKCALNKNDTIIDVGCGASSFIDNLLSRRFTNLIGVDISENALSLLRQRLRKNALLVKWIIDDIANPRIIQTVGEVALWHDRAVLHFLTDENGQQNYLSTLKKILRKKGHAIIATFSLSGAKKCSGLDVKNYDENMLAEFLGPDFKLKEAFNHTYYTPFGSARPYVYTLFQRVR